jgi:hypothetical protein
MQVILDKKGGLKVKIRNLLAVVAMLSVFLIGIGTAHAVLGVNDDVPQQDLAIPLICEKAGNLDTLFAIADKDEAACHYADTNVVTRAAVSLFDYQSRFLQDTVYEWTKHDVVSDTCSRLVAEVAGAPAAAEVVLNGKTYYVIYAIVQQLSPGDVPFQTGDVCAADPTNRFIAWEYLVDLTKGFASGFNAPGAENGIGVEFNEAGGAAPIAVAAFLPRYFFLNDKAETWNWWIYFFGRNELAIENSILFVNVHRNLSGIICDEQENCFSLTIPIPYELNVINVLPKVTPTIKILNGFPGNPAGLGGFAILDIVESGQQTFPQIQISIVGTFTDSFLLDPFDYYSGHAWSYQREQSNDGLPGLSWDVIHPQHRIWCTVSDPVNGADCGLLLP